MAHIEKYEAAKHNEHIQLWLKHHKMKSTFVDMLPENGWVGFDNYGAPTSAGFLRKCEGNFGILDSLITNPKAPGYARHVCIDMVVTEILNYARSQGILQIMATSKFEDTLERATSHGFVRLPHTVIAIDLIKDG